MRERKICDQKFMVIKLTWNVRNLQEKSIFKLELWGKFEVEYIGQQKV